MKQSDMDQMRMKLTKDFVPAGAAANTKVREATRRQHIALLPFDC